MTEIAQDSHRQYRLITGNYWAFTLTDGALRMLVVLHFHQLGYSPFAIATLFLFYEFFGCVTNLVGGWLGARVGLNRTMNLGLCLQIIALLMLAVPSSYLSVPLVMAAQALSGIAKDLNKISAKSAIKALNKNPHTEHGNRLYKWVAILTGSKNALKGVGFFLGGALLATTGFQGSVLIMAAVLTVVWILSLIKLKNELGKSKFTPKFTQVFSKSRAINLLSAARMFLFGSRDVWFVIALPVFLSDTLGWNFTSVGTFLAIWVIGYGIMQSLAPLFTRIRLGSSSAVNPQGGRATIWAALLTVIPASIAVLLNQNINAEVVLIVGLILYGLVFAVNSSLHSYLIVSYADSDRVSLDVGFYYMANALGRLIGTLLSGWIYQHWGLSACLYLSSLFILVATLLSLGLPSSKKARHKPL